MTEPRPIVSQKDRIVDAYQKWYGALFGYICKRIGWDRTEDAEDLVQDVFLHLLSCKSPLAGDRLVRFIYKVAKNQVIDYLRHHACIDAARNYFQDHARKVSCCTDEDVAARELRRKKAQVYALYAHEGKSVQEISAQLALSRRTVENHIFRARSEIREYLSVC